MKGITLARYLMIVTMAMAAGGARAESPQQVEDDESVSGAASAKVEAPPAKAFGSTSRQYPAWSKTPFADRGSAGSRLFEDQKQIWTSPLRLRFPDAEWLLPVAGISSALILTDASFSNALPDNPGTLRHFEDIRNGSVAALGAASGSLYLWSLRTHDPHQRETGLLAGEAVVDSLIVTQGLQL
ncbi:MAG: hypothetical protein WA741_15380, partial [Candidatus Sulfotelmatobacter sp.]